MRLGDKKIVYENHQLVEVVCQLRFPTILSIGAKEPVDFQEKIRRAFPRYLARDEKQTAAGGETGSTKVYSFVSLDGKHKITLSNRFFALSTVGYTSFSDFAHSLDEPLGHFISLYEPACFERVGLRYVNAISREKLGLEGCPWRDLIAAPYLGTLALPGAEEDRYLRSHVESELRLDEQCSLKLHAGPGFVQQNIRTAAGIQRKQDQEPRFILDLDFYASGKLSLQSAPELIDRLHSHADRVFAEAITDKLHTAMEPTYVE